MKCGIRSIVKDGITELYITAAPERGKSVTEQAEEVFQSIAETLKKYNASIFQERVFCTEQSFDTIKTVRQRVYGWLNDSVDPAWLCVPDRGVTGDFAGVVVYAIACGTAPGPIDFEGAKCGRKFSIDGTTLLSLSDIRGNGAVDRAGQSQQMIERAEAIMQNNGMDFANVGRTWMWLGEILQWYGDFNKVRNEFFIGKGLIKKGAPSKMPASTGISIGPIGKGNCTMDLIATDAPIEYLDAGGNQKSAYEYGSAFSRATKIKTPGGMTVYVSGTASIDEVGNTTNLDDADGQIAETIKHVRAVIEQAGCEDDDIVSTIMYCKTPEVEKLFLEKYGDVDWPYMTAVTDICRDDLLFEIEAIAVST